MTEPSRPVPPVRDRAPSVLEIVEAKRHRRGKNWRLFRAWLTKKRGHYKCFWIYPFGHEYELAAFRRRCSICGKEPFDDY